MEPKLPVIAGEVGAIELPGVAVCRDVGGVLAPVVPEMFGTASGAGAVVGVVATAPGVAVAAAAAEFGVLVGTLLGALLGAPAGATLGTFAER